MKITDVIQRRRSVRTFDGTGLRTEDAQKLLAFAEKTENPYGIPIAWKLLEAEKYGLASPVIVGADVYIAGKMRRIPHAEEAFGYAFEKIVLYAESLGIGTTWIAGTMNREAFERAMDLTGEEVMPCVSPLGYPARKMSLRETMMRRGIKADGRMAFGELFFRESFASPLTESEAGRLAPVLEAVRRAPSAVNKQPWRVVLCGETAHFYEKQSRGYTAENGWDLQKIDMGIALAHFELAAAECGFTVSLAEEKPEIPTAEDTVYIASFRIR